MILLTIAMWLTRNPIRRAVLARHRAALRHSQHLSFHGLHRLTRPLHTGHGHRSGSVGNKGNYTAAGNPRTGNRRGPRKGY